MVKLNSHSMKTSFKDRFLYCYNKRIKLYAMKLRSSCSRMRIQQITICGYTIIDITQILTKLTENNTKRKLPDIYRKVKMMHHK